MSDTGVLAPSLEPEAHDKMLDNNPDRTEYIRTYRYVHVLAYLYTQNKLV